MSAMIPRRAFLAAALAALAPSAAAAAKGGKGGELYQPGVKVTVEYWDRDGLFHLVTAELIIVLGKEGIKVGKPALAKIEKKLASMPWEEFSSGNVATTVKQVALDAARSDEIAGPHVVDVLISKLMLR